MVLLPFPRFLLFENDCLDVLLSPKKECHLYLEES